MQQPLASMGIHFIEECIAQAWRQGRTGYPMVDAGMRQLWSEGWLHNRARVVCASFLVKNLLLPWQWGLKHFWDCLVDADLEAAALGWQYCSGCLNGAWSARDEAGQESAYTGTGAEDAYGALPGFSQYLLL